jgi:hypothetical protein
MLRPVRIMVHVRRAQRTPAWRTARRAGKLVCNGLVFGYAPSVATETMFNGRLADGTVLSHELVANLAATAASTMLHDALVIMRALA